MLHDQGLPLFLWAEACNTAVYLQNRSPHRALGHMTPEEAFSGKKPDIGHLHIFGCITYSYIPKEKRTKLEPTAEKGIFVGYSETSKAFRIYIPAQRRVVVRRDVKFEEDTAFRRSRELEYLDQPDPQQQLSQSQGSSGQGSGGSGGSGGTSMRMLGPSVSSGSPSQRGGAPSRSHSSSLGSPLMDNSHGTSASTGSGAGRRTTDRQSGVQATDGDEEFHSPMGEACSGKRKPKWLEDTLRDATSVAEPKRPVRESRPPERFCSYMAMVTSILDSEPSSY